MDEKQEILKRLEIIERKNAEGRERLKRYKDMTFAQVLQEPENIKRLEKLEHSQEEAFNSLIKKRDELKHLKGQEKELFGMYFNAFLKGKVISINDFFYIDRLAYVENRVLKEIFNK